MNKKIWMTGLLVLALAAGVVFAATTAYRLVTTVTHLNVQENMQVQYWDGAVWVDLPVVGGTIDLGTSDISPGETKTLLLRARNNATSGSVDLSIDIETVPELTHDFVCVAVQGTGLEYEEATDLYNLKQVAGADWKQFEIQTTADGGLPPGAIEYDTDMARNNILSSYGDVCA